MSKKHRHKYRLRQSNPVSSHFLFLYSNYNNIILIWDHYKTFSFHQLIIFEHRNKTFRMPKSEQSLLLFMNGLQTIKFLWLSVLYQVGEVRAVYQEVMFRNSYNRIILYFFDAIEIHFVSHTKFSPIIINIIFIHHKNICFPIFINLLNVPECRKSQQGLEFWNSKRNT